MKKWRLDFRILNWIDAMVVSGVPGTVFLRKTFLSWRINSKLLFNGIAIFVPFHIVAVFIALNFTFTGYG